MVGYDFSFWSVSYQIVPYVYLFGSGVQIALSKYLASYEPREDLQSRDKILLASTGVAILLFVFSLIFVILYSECYPKLISDLNFDYKKFKMSAYVMGGMTAFQIFSLIPVGVMMAESKNFLFAIPQFFVRLFTLAMIYAVVNMSNGYYYSIFLVGFGNFLVSVVLLIILYQRFTWVRLIERLVLDAAHFKAILKYCSAILVTMLAGAAINVVSISIVGFYDFRNVGLFSLAITVSTVIGGLLNSLLSPAMPVLARLHAENDANKFREFFYKITMIGTCIVCMLALAYFLVGDYLLVAWVGKIKAFEAQPYVTIVFYANIFRFLLFPYAVLLLALGCGRVMVYAAVSESIVNLIFTFIFGYLWGAKGAAFASVVAGCFGFLWHFFVSMRLASGFLSGRLNYFLKFMVKPLLIFVVPIIFIYYALVL
jgi:O-antigen/teichoic acid export membrane protein